MKRFDVPHGPDDVEHWWSALGGKPAPGCPEAVRLEAERLRRAVLDAEGEVTNSGDDSGTDHDARFERLMFRLRAEGLLQGSAPAAPRRTPAVFRPWFAAAAAIVGVAVAIPFLTTRHDIEGPAYFDESQWKTKSMRIPDPLPATEPRAVVGELVELLEAEGVPFDLETRADGILLRAMLEAGTAGAVRQWLTERGLRVPDDGALWLEILPEAE